jgi:hypothetical protein
VDHFPGLTSLVLPVHVLPPFGDFGMDPIVAGDSETEGFPYARPPGNVSLRNHAIPSKAVIVTAKPRRISRKLRKATLVPIIELALLRQRAKGRSDGDRDAGLLGIVKGHLRPSPNGRMESGKPHLKYRPKAVAPQA